MKHVAVVGTHTQQFPPLPQIATQPVGLCAGLHHTDCGSVTPPPPTDPVLIYPNTEVIFYPYISWVTTQLFSPAEYCKRTLARPKFIVKLSANPPTVDPSPLGLTMQLLVSNVPFASKISTNSPAAGFRGKVKVIAPPEVLTKYALFTLNVILLLTSLIMLKVFGIDLNCDAPRKRPISYSN